ncbi:translocation/assembly module TamB domain-containing protein [Noviherbaspirillum saxi]|uniref:translocation/assembly module TamB domain-containing protein n=1 Tax=Noviherbaspirillum saxi TaxID=2320863 RepID=UPI001314C601|nr:translocation/assembly module TamB domain-containing protein [Noviherbaspirillum saxi]
MKKVERSGRRLRRITVTLLILALLPALALAWLLASESGARAAFRIAASLADGALQTQGIHGRLVGPLRIEQLAISQPGQNINLREVTLDWKPGALLKSTFHLTRLHIAHADVALIGESKDEPAKMPARIALPLKVRLDSVAIDRGTVRRGPTVPSSTEILRLGPSGFALSFDGSQYQFRLRELTLMPTLEKGTATARISGDAELATEMPYALKGSFHANSKAVLDDRTIGADGKLLLSGSMADLAADIDLLVNRSPIRGRVNLQPFSERPLGATQLNASALDLSALSPELPQSSLDIRLASDDNGAGELRIVNREPGLVNDKKIPLSSLQLAFTQEAGEFRFQHIAALLGSPKASAGEVLGDGTYAPDKLRLNLRTEALDLRRLDSRIRSTRLAGTVALQQDAGRQEFTVKLNEPLKRQRLTLDAHGVLADNTLSLDRAELRVGAGSATLSGMLGMADSQGFRAEGRIDRFRLQDLGEFAQVPELLLNARFAVEGRRQPELEADLSFSIIDSRLAGQALRGDGKVSLHGEVLDVPKFLLASGDNRLSAEGKLSEGDSQLAFSLDAQRLAQLGPAFAGVARARGTVKGSFMRPRVQAEWSAGKVRAPGAVELDSVQGQVELSLDRTRAFILETINADIRASGVRQNVNRVRDLTLQARFAPKPDAPLQLLVRGEGMESGAYRANRFNLTANGTTGQHRIDATIAEPGQNWYGAASGTLSQPESDPRWTGSITALNGSGRFNARLAGPARLMLSADQTQVDGLVIDADRGRIAVEQFARDAGGMRTRGRLEKIQLSQILRLLEPAPPLRTDLQFSGDWNLQVADTLSGSANLRRDSGDATVLGGTSVTLGLRSLNASLSADEGRLALQIQAEGRQLGNIDARVTTRAGSGAQRLSFEQDAPVSGNIRIDVPSLAWTGPLIAPTASIAGRLQSEIAIEGSIGTPRLAGSINGDGLRIAMADLGIDLRQGVLKSEFQGERLVINALRFEGAEGNVTVTGPIDLKDGNISALLALRAERFALLSRADRRVIISGDSRIAVADKRPSVTGAFTVDSGFIDLGSADKPELSSDVVIVGQEKKSGQKTGAAVDLSIGLGDGIKLKGRGIDGTLVGKLRILSDPAGTLQAQGTLSIYKGTFSAYGRELKIEQGLIRFTGPLNNPALDILAMRRGQEVEAGVSVRGTVLAPRVSLVSEPSVADAEKLSWLVLGRGLATANPGDAGTLQSAAAALLSKGAQAGLQSRIASAFGLDTFSVGTSDDTLQQRIVTLGKQISSRLYLSYQQGLENAGSVVQLRYTLTPRLSVEAEAGARSAVSLFYNIAFD